MKEYAVANCFLSARAAWLGIGIVIGMVIGVVLPHAPLHATATDRQDTFAIATGMVDDGIEAVYMLDFLTGDLRAAVLNPNTRTFSSTFQRNIARRPESRAGQEPALSDGQRRRRPARRPAAGSSAIRRCTWPN